MLDYTIYHPVCCNVELKCPACSRRQSSFVSSMRLKGGQWNNLVIFVLYGFSELRSFIYKCHLKNTFLVLIFLFLVWVRRLATYNLLNEKQVIGKKFSSSIENILWTKSFKMPNLFDQILKNSQRKSLYYETYYENRIILSAVEKHSIWLETQLHKSWT